MSTAQLSAKRGNTLILDVYLLYGALPDKYIKRWYISRSINRSYTTVACHALHIYTIGENKTKIRDCYPLISTIAILISLALVKLHSSKLWDHNSWLIGIVSWGRAEVLYALINIDLPGQGRV